MCPTAAPRLEQVTELFWTFRNHVMVGVLGFDAPLPGVLERGYLSRGIFAATLSKQDVVGGVGVEWRIEVDEIDTLIRDVLAQYVQVVAEVELVSGRIHEDGFYRQPLHLISQVWRDARSKPGNDRCLILDVNDNIVNFKRNLAFTELDWLWD